MKKITFLLFIAMLSVSIQAQDFQGKAIYQSKTTIDFDFQGRDIPEARRQQIIDAMKKGSERSYELVFDRTTSLYKEEEKLETPGGGNGGFQIRMGFGGQNSNYFKDIAKQEYRRQSDMFGKMFLIRDSLTQWEWSLGSETKQIGNYTCYKATAIRKIDTAQAGRMARLFRRPQEEETKKDSTAQDSTKSNSLLSRISAEEDREIIAWFTPEIPISQGPGPYWGLPGLIMEVNDGRTAILCSKLILNPEDRVEISPPDKGKEVNQQEYDDISFEKMKEMSERFRAGNRGRGNRVIIRN